MMFRAWSAHLQRWDATGIYFNHALRCFRPILIPRGAADVNGVNKDTSDVATSSHCASLSPGSYSASGRNRVNMRNADTQSDTIEEFLSLSVEDRSRSLLQTTLSSPVSYQVAMRKF